MCIFLPRICIAGFSAKFKQIDIIAIEHKSCLELKLCIIQSGHPTVYGKIHNLAFGLHSFVKPEIAWQNDESKSVDLWVIEPIDTVACVV